MYLITTEALDDGTWMDEPEGFDTQAEAHQYVASRKPPKGGCFVLYNCTFVKMFELADNSEQR